MNLPNSICNHSEICRGDLSSRPKAHPLAATGDQVGRPYTFSLCRVHYFL